MRRLYVAVNCDHTAEGKCVPLAIKWGDSRQTEIRRVLYSCTSPTEFEGIRYTILQEYIARASHRARPMERNAAFRRQGRSRPKWWGMRR